jgi:hypothetical protein
MTRIETNGHNSDLSCTRCGYSLHTLDSASRCPECGRAVAESIEALNEREATFGPPLREHSAAWLRCAASGLFVFLMGAGVIVVAGWFIRSPVRWLILTASQVIGTFGIWLFTIRPIRPQLRGEWLRWSTRILLTIWCIASAIANIGIVMLQRHVGGDARIWIALFSGALGSLAAFVYLAHLAGRMRKLLVRRVFLGLILIPILMTLAVMKMAKGVYFPTVCGIALPGPSYPCTGGLQWLVATRVNLKQVFAGLLPWSVFLKEDLPLSIVELISNSAVLWYAMILVAMASRRAEQEAADGKRDRAGGVNR